MFEDLNLLETAVTSEADVFTWDMPADEPMAMKLANPASEAIFTSAVEALDIEESPLGEDMAEDEQAPLEQDVEADADEEESADELGSDDYAEETQADVSEQMEEDSGDETTGEEELIFEDSEFDFAGVFAGEPPPHFRHGEIKGVHDRDLGHNWLWVKLPPEAIDFLQEVGIQRPEIITDPTVEVPIDPADYLIF